MYISLKHNTRWDFCTAPYIYNAYMFRLYSLIWWNTFEIVACILLCGAVWKSYPMLLFLPYITSHWNPKLTGVCAGQMSLFRILQVMNVNVDVDALHSLRKQPTFCDFAAVSPRNDWRNSILMTCQWGGHKGGTNTAIPHVVAREYRDTASKFSQIPKPHLQMGKSWCCQYYKSSFQIEIILLCQCFQIKVRRCQAYDKHKIIALV